VLAINLLKKETQRVADSVVFNRNLASTLKNKIESSTIFEKDVKIIGDNNILISNAFIPSDNILEFINVLDDLASHKSIPQTYNFGTPVPASIAGPFPLSTISYTNSLTTNLLGLSNYLKDFAKLPYFTQIQSINITAQDISGWNGTSTVSMNTVVFTKTIQ
jgi:hypothetical protein